MRLLLLLLTLSFSSLALCQEALQRYGYRVLNSYPHDIGAFTQGLAFREGYLYEGTGKNGLSSLSKIELEDGEVLQSTRLGQRYFGEGIELVGDRIYQLTWRSHMVFVYDRESFEQLQTCLLYNI